MPLVANNTTLTELRIRKLSGITCGLLWLILAASASYTSDFLPISQVTEKHLDGLLCPIPTNVDASC